METQLIKLIKKTFKKNEVRKKKKDGWIEGLREEPEKEKADPGAQMKKTLDWLATLLWMIYSDSLHNSGASNGITAMRKQSQSI